MADDSDRGAEGGGGAERSSTHRDGRQRPGRTRAEPRCATTVPVAPSSSVPNGSTPPEVTTRSRGANQLGGARWRRARPRLHPWTGRSGRMVDSRAPAPPSGRGRRGTGRPESTGASPNHGYAMQREAPRSDSRSPPGPRRTPGQRRQGEDKHCHLRTPRQVGSVTTRVGTQSWPEALTRHGGQSLTCQRSIVGGGCHDRPMPMTTTRIPLLGPYDLREVALMGFGHRDQQSFDGVMRLGFCVDGDHESQVGVALRSRGRPHVRPGGQRRTSGRSRRRRTSGRQGGLGRSRRPRAIRAAVPQRSVPGPGLRGVRQGSGRPTSTPRTKRRSGRSSAPGAHAGQGDRAPPAAGRDVRDRPHGSLANRFRWCRRPVGLLEVGDSARPTGGPDSTTPRHRRGGPAWRPGHRPAGGDGHPRRPWPICSGCLASGRSTAR